MKKRTKYGFTLVELLVVIVIILLLAGMLFRVGNLMSDRSNRARATADLQALANALEEYFAVYGMYPPADNGDLRYVFPNPSMRPPLMDRDDVTGLRLNGLYAYLFRRGGDDPRLEWDGSPTIESTKDRWQHYLADVNRSSGAIGREFEGETDLLYSNAVRNVSSPWGGRARFQYESNPPYLSYRLWVNIPNSDDVLSVSSTGH